MYALPKGNTNKLFVKTRRGISQKFDLDTRDSYLKDTNILPITNLSSYKPVFYVSKKASQSKTKESVTPQHEEMVKYVHETWKNVVKDLECCSNSLSSAAPAPQQPNTTASLAGNECATSANVQNELIKCNKKLQQVYYHSSTNTKLPSFEPFDLESFWGQRLYQNLTQC